MMRELSSFASFLYPRGGVLSILLACITLVATLVGVRLTSRHLLRFLPDRNVAVALSRVSTVLIAAVGLSYAFGFLGFNGIPFITVGTIGIVVGLSFQSTATSMVNGLWVLGEESFHEGDTITVAPAPPYTGRVEDVQMRYIQLRKENGNKLIVPTMLIFANVIEVEAKADEDSE